MPPMPLAAHPTATAAPARPPASPARRGGVPLQAALAAWLAVAFAGQLAFAAYVLALYGGAAASGQFARWNTVTPRGWRADDPLGNLVFGAHVLFTVVVVLGGLVQLLPPLRRHAPALHRWNGRLYLVAAVVLAAGGVAMLLTRGTVGGMWQQAGTALNGLVVLVCAAQAWRHARAGHTAAHRRWALRLFLAVSGVWFFRIGLMAWLMAWGAPVGFDPKAFSGPFLTVLALAQFMLSLAVLELVFRAQAGTHRRLRAATTALVLGLTGLTALGIAGAVLGMWWPRVAG